MTELTHFNCQNCNAGYRVVRVEADSTLPYREITCRNCGAPLRALEGGSFLKYILIDRPKVASGPRGRPTAAKDGA